jgi:hypothetical protein
MTLLEMREAVWRNLAAIYPGSVDPVTGQSFNPRIDPLFTKEDVDLWINESLTGHFLDVTENADEVFADEATLDVVANTPEIELPEDMAFFRSAWWKPVNYQLSQAPPSGRTFMLKVDDPGTTTRDMVGAGSVPRYRLQLDFLVLEPVSTVDNPGGVLVRYIKWAQHLAQDDQIIESQFARVLQECVILEAAMSGAGRKAFLDVSPLKISYDIWRERLMVAARRYNVPTSVQIRTVMPIRLYPGSRSSMRRRLYFT